MKKKIFKTIITVLTLASVLFSVAVSGFCSENEEVTVYVNGIKINFDVEPIIEDGRTLVPLRYIFEALGAKVDWRAETSTAVATRGTDTVEITVGEKMLYKNGTPTELDVGAKLLDGRTLVPVRAVSEGMGCDVSWDEENRRVIIAEKGALPYNQLSEEDTQKLKNSYNKILEDIIYDGIYDSIKASGSSEFYKGISSNAEDARVFVDSLWQNQVINAIINVQMESETYYLVNEYEENTQETISNSYAALVENLGMSPSDVYTSSFEKTPKGKDLLLLTVKDKNAVCSFAAIVATNESVRYFVFSSSEDLGFFEITDTGISGYNFAANDKKGFLAAIDKA